MRKSSTAPLPQGELSSEGTLRGEAHDCVICKWGNVKAEYYYREKYGIHAGCASPGEWVSFDIRRRRIPGSQGSSVPTTSKYLHQDPYSQERSQLLWGGEPGKKKRKSALPGGPISLGTNEVGPNVSWSALKKKTQVRLVNPDDRSVKGGRRAEGDKGTPRKSGTGGGNYFFWGGW